jgi:hypothetical protein
MLSQGEPLLQTSPPHSGLFLWAGHPCEALFARESGLTCTGQCDGARRSVRIGRHAEQVLLEGSLTGPGIDVLGVLRAVPSDRVRVLHQATFDSAQDLKHVVIGHRPIPSRSGDDPDECGHKDNGQKEGRTAHPIIPPDAPGVALEIRPELHYRSSN